MAGGIDWFRWHHGSVSDGKFALVAHKAGASVAEVIAVWACLLEAASAAEDRGDPGVPDFETLDFTLGMKEGSARRIYERMRERALLDGDTGRIASWEKRQPKREDDTAAERKRRQREREHELSVAACVTEEKSRDVTQGHDREEKSRGEEVIPSLLTQAPARQAPDGPQLALVDAPKPRAKTVPDCPHQAILALWAEVLPALPQHNPEMWNGTRADHLRARWRETAASKGWESVDEGLTYFRRLFGYIGQSAFLTGKAKPAQGKPPFIAELAWVVSPQSWAKVHEGKYHSEAA